MNLGLGIAVIATSALAAIIAGCVGPPFECDPACGPGLHCFYGVCLPDDDAEADGVGDVGDVRDEAREDAAADADADADAGADADADADADAGADADADADADAGTDADADVDADTDEGGH